MNEYYVYAYLDPNKPGDYVYGDYEFEYEPFYIGKGKKNRMFYHLSKRSLKKNSHKNDKINELILENKQPKIIKILDGLCEMDSYKYEIEIIKSIGRILDGGVLTNKTLGGEGSLGTHISVETREKCRKASSKRAIFIKGKTYEEIYGEEKGKELRELNGKYRVGKTYEDIYGEDKANDIRLKQSKSQKGKKKISEEGKKKLREINLGKKQSQETKDKISKSLIGNKRHLGKKHTQETKDAISEKNKGVVSWNAEAIYQLDKDDNILNDWRSAKYAAEQLGLSQGNIWSVINGDRKTCGGFKWIKKD